MSKVTLHTLQKKKETKEPITMITAYDYPTAVLVDQCDIDMVLVGDTVGMVVHGFENTLSVSMEMMIMHCAAVRRGLKRAYLVGDMPFPSYQISVEQGKRNAARLLTEAHVDAIKMEGGQSIAETIRGVHDMGIAVMGHVGLTPQSISAMGGFKVQGKTFEAARRVIMDATAVEEAGAFALVLEGIPERLARLISRRLSIPTIGIGAGVHCDGQVLVWHDMLGMFFDFTPKFVKQYGDVSVVMKEGIQAYTKEVRRRAFPAQEHSFTMPNDVYDKLESEFG